MPESIPSQHRQPVLSRYSRPDIRPGALIRHAQQMEPLHEPLMEKGCERLSLQGSYFERALFRGTLRAWLKRPHREACPR